MKIRIVLLPDRQTTSLVKKYSALISERYPSYFRLDRTHIPHVTITNLESNNDSSKSVNSLMKNLSREYTYLSAEADEIKTGGPGFIGIYFTNNLEIKKLREKVLGVLESYKLEDLSNKNLHLTLIRLRSENKVPGAVNLIKSFPKKRLKFDHLAICEESEYGTCKNVIVSHPLIG